MMPKQNTLRNVTHIPTGEQFMATTERAPMLPIALEELHKNLSSLSDSIDRLYSRLTPIMSEFPESPPQDKDVVKPNIPQAINSVRDASTRVVLLNDHLTMMIAHLEV